MANELLQHPQVALLDFHTFPPLENEQIDFLEKKYTLKIPNPVRDFYCQTNGLQLRWVFTNKDNFSQKKYQNNEAILPWDFFQKEPRWEDGGIMLLPLEMALKQKILDAFSQDYNMIFTFEKIILTVSEDGEFSNDFLTTDFESYLEFLIAGYGLTTRRIFFYGKNKPAASTIPPQTKQDTQPDILTPESFWTLGKKLNLDQALLKDIFPLADQTRFFENKINRNGLRQMAKNDSSISLKQLEEIIEKHHQFLMEGGHGGQWKVIEIRGIVTAFYDCQNKPKTGEQAIFERKNITHLSFEKIELPFSNFCAAFAEGTDFSNANFEKSLFTDAFLEGANFSESDFSGVDFSRSDLRNANFQNTNLTGADFENCNLEGANFQGAKLDKSKFVGASNITFTKL